MLLLIKYRWPIIDILEIGGSLYYVLRYHRIFKMTKLLLGLLIFIFLNTDYANPSTNFRHYFSGGYKHDLKSMNIVRWYTLRTTEYWWQIFWRRIGGSKYSASYPLFRLIMQQQQQGYLRSGKLPLGNQRLSAKLFCSIFYVFYPLLYSKKFVPCGCGGFKAIHTDTLTPQ